MEDAMKFACETSSRLLVEAVGPEVLAELNEATRRFVEELSRRMVRECPALIPPGILTPRARVAAVGGRALARGPRTD